MTLNKLIILAFLLLFLHPGLMAQLSINEGSNKNFSLIADEDGDFPDWIEIVNKSSYEVNLSGYHLSDDPGVPAKWTFPDVSIPPNGYLVVFCSGKDRKPTTGSVIVTTAWNYTPIVGWNTHNFAESFYWDGESNIIINTCSFNSNGYTSNSVFRQTITPFLSTVYAAQDYSDAACNYEYGTASNMRPNMKINGKLIGNGVEENAPTTYPAPYGNWYWSARNQMLIRASELIAAGLSSGDIYSLAFRVVSTDPNTHYSYVQINMKQVPDTSISYRFQPYDPNISLHTNFKISGSGETISLYTPSLEEISNLNINCYNTDISMGRKPNGSDFIYSFSTPTPRNSNNQSIPYLSYLSEPLLDIPAGIYDAPVNVSIMNPNGDQALIYYTLDGNDPDLNSAMYTGQPIQINSSVVLKARAINSELLPSKIKTASYLINVDHSTPIISVTTENSNLYGSNGMFDNWWLDMDKPAFVDFFDSTKQLIFSKNVGIQMDGGAGGSRAHPQHSFRIELDHSVLGDGSINYPLIPDRENRLKYSKIYLRNGSNQYLVLPYKDAAQVRLMGKHTNNYYSAWRPITVYINGDYFGLYELREKFDTELFKSIDNSDNDSIDILSQSYWYGGILRPVAGRVDDFYTDAALCRTFDPADTAFWTQTDKYFDLTYYTDYIIAETWIANTDWPYNNIKIYRSNKTGNRWRFCIIDMELSLAPNGWNDFTFDHIKFMLEADPYNPYISLWQRGMTNGRFKNYFINRFADVMNTAYKPEVLVAGENMIYQLVKPEMPNEYERWGDPNNVTGQMLDFIQNHSTFRQQLAGRSEFVRSHVMDHFSLKNLVDVTLDVQPADGGKIKISTISPDEYPWEGIYFNGVPVKIEAIPNENYAFIGWNGNELLSDTTVQIFDDTLNCFGVTFKANFISTLSAKPTEENAGLSVYPNPASEMMYLQNDNTINIQTYEYSIHSINGAEIVRMDLDPSSKLNKIQVSSLKPAIYLLKIKCREKPDATFRFIKY